MPDTELDHERRIVAEFYARLDELRADTAVRLDRVRRQSVGGNHQARTERDAFAQLYEDQLAQLREVDARLVFGRLLLTAGGHRYIGRIGLRDDDQHALLIDWRAPQAAAFYQATAAEPLGVQARRHLTMRGRDVIRVDDEIFDEALLVRARADLDSGGSPVQGEAALLAAVAVERTGRMGDIVATIQAEQDRIIRSELRGALVVQGAPGTGKTAVALHRAAYLLYANRQRLASSGVLVVGPSAAFLRYIEAVLPSLGETGVVLRSLGDLVPGVDATGDDAPDVAALKGDLRMARLLSRAVHSRQKVPTEVQTLTIDGETLRVEPALIREAMERARRSRKPHNEARVTFVKHALSALTDELASQLRARGNTVDDADAAVLREDLRTSYDVRVLLNTAWLPLTPQKLLEDLYARPSWLAELTPNWSARDRALLHRERGVELTVSDVALLDEAAELLGEAPAGQEPAAQERARQRKRDLENARSAIRNMGVEGLVTAEQVAGDFAEHGSALTTSERAAADRSWVYGHIVVDEAQELTPMQWRLLVRRCPMRSFTIVGDIAQAGNVAAAPSWSAAMTPFFRDGWRLEQLTVNYRTPARIARVAEEQARRNGLPVTPARAVREGEWDIRTVRAPEPQFASAVADAALAARASVPAGTLAVIAPVRRQAAVAAALEGAFGADIGTGPGGLDTPISCMTAIEAKGLEFDCVVLADPDGVVAESPRGAGALYVSMTRATQLLALVTPAD